MKSSLLDQTSPHLPLGTSQPLPWQPQGISVHFSLQVPCHSLLNDLKQHPALCLPRRRWPDGTLRKSCLLCWQSSQAPTLAPLLLVAMFPEDLYRLYLTVLLCLCVHMELCLPWARRDHTLDVLNVWPTPEISAAFLHGKTLTQTYYASPSAGMACLALEISAS